MKFAEFAIGQVLEFGEYTVSEHEIVEFATRYDPQPFHTDKAWAQVSRWNGLISSGFHTCSIAMRMVVEHVLRGSESIGSPGIDHLKWQNPVRPGDRLRMRTEVLETRISRSGRMGSVRWRWLMRNQDDQPVLDATVTSLFALQPMSEEQAAGNRAGHSPAS